MSAILPLCDAFLGIKVRCVRGLAESRHSGKAYRLISRIGVPLRSTRRSDPPPQMSSETLGTMLSAFEEYMPAPHRAFLEQVHIRLLLPCRLLGTASHDVATPESAHTPSCSFHL